MPLEFRQPLLGNDRFGSEMYYLFPVHYHLQLAKYPLSPNRDRRGAVTSDAARWLAAGRPQRALSRLSDETRVLTAIAATVSLAVWRCESVCRYFRRQIRTLGIDLSTSCAGLRRLEKAAFCRKRRRGRGSLEALYGSLKHERSEPRLADCLLFAAAKSGMIEETVRRIRSTLASV